MNFLTVETLPVSDALERPDEVLVADTRAGLTPSDMVRRKLMQLLYSGSVSDSHVRIGGPLDRGCGYVSGQTDGELTATKP